MSPLFNPTARAELQLLHDPLLRDYGVRLRVLRLDSFFPQLSGNKYFKLKYNLQQARQLGYRQLLSFGGAYSNHLHALAWAARECDFDAVAVVRGERAAQLSPTLQDALDWGMRLHFVSRSDYRRRAEADFLSDLQSRLGPAFVIPEGGSNLLALRGCAEIIAHLQGAEAGCQQLFLPCGTGATLAGVVSGLSSPAPKVVGVSVLKGDFLSKDVSRLLAQAGIVRSAVDWRIEQRFHHGGYARCSRELAHFIRDFSSRTGLALEPVYSGKMFYAIYQMLAAGEIALGSELLAIHTGGMQGLRGMQEKMDKLLLTSG